MQKIILSSIITALLLTACNSQSDSGSNNSTPTYTAITELKGKLVEGVVDSGYNTPLIVKAWSKGSGTISFEAQDNNSDKISGVTSQGVVSQDGTFSIALPQNIDLSKIETQSGIIMANPEETWIPSQCINQYSTDPEYKKLLQSKIISFFYLTVKTATESGTAQFNMNYNPSVILNPTNDYGPGYGNNMDSGGLIYSDSDYDFVKSGTCTGIGDGEKMTDANYAFNLHVRKGWNKIGMIFEYRATTGNRQFKYSLISGEFPAGVDWVYFPKNK